MTGDPAEDLVGRGGQVAVEVGLELRALSGCSNRASIPPPTALRVVSPPALISRRKNQLNSSAVEPLAVDDPVHEGRRDVAGGLGELAIPDVRRVQQHLEHRRTRFFGRRAGRVHLLREDVQPAAVVQRDAEHVGDDVGRELAGDVLDEVALATLDDLVDDLRGELGDAPAYAWA